MHTRNDTDTMLRSRIAQFINGIENLKIELSELAGDLSDDKQRFAVEDFCSAIEDATKDCLEAFGHDSAIEFFNENNA